MSNDKLLTVSSVTLDALVANNKALFEIERKKIIEIIKREMGEKLGEDVVAALDIHFRQDINGVYADFYYKGFKYTFGDRGGGKWYVFDPGHEIIEIDPPYFLTRLDANSEKLKLIEKEKRKNKIIAYVFFVGVIFAAVIGIVISVIWVH